MIWFMAAWCPSCVGQANAIKQVKSEFGDKVDIFVIDLWSMHSIGRQGADCLKAETADDLQAFLSKHGSSQWKAAMDTDRVAIKYGIIEVDSTVVVGGNGNIILKHLGPSGYQPLKEALSKVIA